jgi:regulatory protein
MRPAIPESGAQAGDTGPDPAIEIEAQAIRLLAQREHSRHELSGKLTRRFDPGCVQTVLDELQARGLVSDQRFTEQYVDLRIRKGFGPLRIRAELRERGIAGELAEASLDLGDEGWLACLKAAAQQRFGADAPGTAREQARQARFLQYRGFPESLVRRYLWD